MAKVRASVSEPATQQRAADMSTGAGEEIGRVIGPAEWDTSEIIAFVKCFVSRNEVASQSDSKLTAIPPCAGHDLGLPASSTSTSAQP